MSNILMVPVHLDALYLKHEESVVEAMADFSRLPYCNGNRDVNSDIANISEEIVSQPFQNQNLGLKAGIHLHWSLPDALTKSVGIRIVRNQTFLKRFEPDGKSIWNVLKEKGWIKEIDQTQASVMPRDKRIENTLGNGFDAKIQEIETFLYHPLGSSFPSVPNRWLVTRGGDKFPMEQWVVESDYLYPEGQGSQQGSVSIPFSVDSNGKDQPFRYLGRKIPLKAWLTEDQTKSKYLEELTAVGYGEPTFAAFYPNCHSVFGFYDKYTGEGNAVEGLQYDIVGWYSNPKQDYLKTVIENFRNTYQGKERSQPSNKELLKAIEEQLKWTIVSHIPETFPEQMLCYARLTFKANGNSTGNQNDAPITITVGNTGTEALSAYLATKIDNNNKSTIEEQLEALHLSSRLENRQLDIGAKFKEARHEKGFNAIPAGCLWTVRQKTESTLPANAADAHEREQIILPEEIGGQLNAANGLQQAYDRAADEMESMRKQIFADWYKYMICAYSPEGSRDDYPDIDEVKHYIEKKGIAPLERKIANTGSLTLQKDSFGKIIDASSDSQSKTESLAFKLAKALKKLLKTIEAHNKVIAERNSNTLKSDKKAKTIYTLKPVPAPRYWQPKEPVVLMTGEAVQPTLRHGQDGRLRPKDGLLDCQILPTTKDSSTRDFFVSNFFSEIKKKINEIQPKNTQEESIAFSTWEKRPWYPFLLEWEVEVFPIESQENNLKPDSRNYENNFIISHYTLSEKEPDLVKKQEVARAQAANVYSGRSILTPHAGIQLKEQVEVYLSKQILAEYYSDKEISQKRQTESYMSQNFDAICQWYEGKILSDLDTPENKVKDPIFTAIRAYKELQNLSCLSQALSGFNEALLMHKQTLQLEIAEPLGFDDYQEFTKKVRKAVQNSNRSAPEPLNDFNPIRSGAMKILQLRLVDTFGQVKELDISHINTTEVMTTKGKNDFIKNDFISLPPRLVQPARLNFRWLSASQGEQEMNAHPATTPICGWLLPNNLDKSLMIYDNKGIALGSINRQAKWESAPGEEPVRTVKGIANPQLKEIEKIVNPQLKEIEKIVNPHLKKMVSYLLKRDGDFLDKFIDVLDTTLENIEPENYAKHQSLALLIGQPLAVVRASLNLELKGQPAINEDWNCFRQDLRRNSRDDDNFTLVKFPIRIGDYHQLNDGLVGYWKEKENDYEEEKENDYEDDIFYAPKTDNIKDKCIKYHLNDLNICQSIKAAKAAPQVLTMLVDPKGKVHATSGILPTKVIDIPPDQYAAALQAIGITFLSTPILTNYRQMSLPLPVEPGYSWSWLEEENETWTEIAIAPRIEQKVFKAEFSKTIWNHLLDRSIGWLLAKNNKAEATVSDKDNRKSPTLGEGFNKFAEIIEEILRQHQNSGTINQQIFFEQINTKITVRLWNELLAKNWLKALDESKTKASVVPKDSRTSASGNPPSLGEIFTGLEGQIEIIFDLYAVRITPASTKAEFSGQQVIREGWLKLSRSTEA